MDTAQPGTTLVSTLPITAVEAIPISIPLTKPMRMGSSTLTNALGTIVRLEAEDGTVGWGEVTDAAGMTGESQAIAHSTIASEAAPILSGANAYDWEEIDRRLLAETSCRTGARSAIDIALHDLIGRHTGFSVNHLLGGGQTKTFSPMWLLGNKTAEADAEEAAAKHAAGFGFFKQKVGVKSLDDDIRTAHLVRAAVGPAVSLTADANTAWTVEQAQKFAAETTDVGFLCLEQPVPRTELDQMAAVAAGPLPIAADEGIHSLDDIGLHADRGAASGVSLKFLKLGGYAELRKAAEICRARRLSINLACKVGETSLGSAAMLHFAATIGAPEWGLSLTNSYLSDDIVQVPIAFDDGTAAVPPGPGLGVEIDRDKIDKYRVG